MKMSSYHCSIKVLTKSKGRSAVQFSAYMSGEKDYNEITGEIYDHTSKEEVVFNEMLFSKNVPEEMQNQHSFWNEVEKNEQGKNSQLSRVYEVALPNEFSIEENIKLAMKYGKSLVEEDGYSAVQIAVHAKQGNIHAHIMGPVRQMDENGKWQSKEIKGYVCENQEGEEKIFRSVKDIEPGYERVPILDENGNQKMDSRNRLQWKREYIETNELNQKSKVHEWRQRWEEYQNSAIEKHNLEHNENVEMVSCKTLKAQGINREPTIHEGYAARKMEEQGIISERCSHNRNVNLKNEILETENNILEQQKIIDRLKEEFTKFMEEMKHGITTAADRLRAAINRSSGEDRTTNDIIGRERKRAITVELVDRSAQLNQLKAEQLRRRADAERLRAETVARIKEEQRRRDEEERAKAERAKHQRSRADEDYERSLY